MVVCIDEFQQIGEFPDTVKFQKILRNHWQEHKDVAYILYGDSALQAMLYSLNLQFINLMDSLTEKQRNFLCAICKGVKNFSSAETLHLYRLGTSGNIRILKNALLKRDLIDVTGKKHPTTRSAAETVDY